MSNTFQQAVKIRRVSLQLSSQKSKKNDHLAQSRVSLCYSSNLKKRTDALSAQRTGINQFLQKTHSLIKPIPQPISTKTSSHQPKRKQKNISPSTPSKTPTLIDHKGQIKINLSRIEITAKSMEIKSRRNINSNNQFSQSHNKNNENGILDYRTITISQIMKQKMNTQPLSESQPFTHIRQMIWSAKVTKNKKNDMKSSCKNRKVKTMGIETMTIPCKNLLSSQKITSKKQILKKQIEDKIIQRDKNLNGDITQNTQFLITQISKKIPCKTIQISKIPLNSNRICTTKLSTLGANTQIDTIASNSHSFAHPGSTANKSTYKTSNINLSQHFSLFQQRQRQLAREREGLSSGFPLCKKAAMSTFNKYYQNIIQEVKNREFKIKSQLKQQAEKDNEVEQQISDDTKNIEIQDNVKQNYKKTRLYKNFTINMTNFETVKSISLQKEMVRNLSVQGNTKNFTKNSDKNKRIKNSSENEQSNSKLIHSVHKHVNNNQFSNIVTNPNISKNIKMYQNHNLVWFEMGNANTEENNMEELEINNTICKKKQLLERPLYAEENKKRILKHYGKSLAKKCNTQILHNNFTNQEYLKSMQVYGQLSYSRMERPKSKHLDNKKCNKLENKEQSIAGWDVLNVENDAHDENF